MILRIGVLILVVAAFSVGAAARVRTVLAQASMTGEAAVPSRYALSGVSDRFELLLKYDALGPGDKATLDLYLSDFASNAPVAEAAISLSLRSGSRELWKGTAVPTARPGIYAVPFDAPADTGSFNMLVTVRSADDEGRFALTGFTVRVDRNTGTSESRARPVVWPWIVGVGVVLLASVAALSRRRRLGAMRVMVLVLGAAFSPAAEAHEGHDVAPTIAGAPVGPGAQVYVRKESQFLLGVRTEPLKRMLVQRQLTVLGRVAPRGGGEVVISAPQSGRIYFDGKQAPVIGQTVTKGRAVARLTVVDDLDLRAPITGVITGVFVVQGQLVEAGQKLMTLLDPSIVWVHADVYEQDVPSVQHSTQATITSQAMPELVLPGRRVAIGVTQGEVLGTVEAWFEVPNAGRHLKVGSLVDVSIEQGGADSALVVPRSSVFEKDGRKLVFVHTAPERFTAKEVTPRTSLGARVTVEGDLLPGDRIVTAGGYQMLAAPVVSLGS